MLVTAPPSAAAAPAATSGPPNAAAHRVAACPLCQSRRLHYAFSKHYAPLKQPLRVVRCADCRLILLNPQPSDVELADIYGERYFIGQEHGVSPEQFGQMKAATARLYFGQLARYRGAVGGALLEIGCGQGELLAEAEAGGFDVTGVEVSESAAAHARRRLRSGRVFVGNLESAGLTDHTFDVCVLADVIEHVRDPLAFLQSIRRLLKPGGAVLIATPSLDSWSARLLKHNWMEFKPEHLTLFDANTMQNALHQAGFKEAVVLPGHKVLNFDYVAGHFDRFPVPLLTRAFRTGQRLLPPRVRQANVRIVASGMVVLATAAPEGRQRTLSIIIPAFNESATIAAVLDGVLRKEVPGVNAEIIVVESNSTDGTREIVRQYAQHPQIKLVLEDRPRGKGHAVRAGLARATGDFVLIQDADLEYDLEDYDTLIEPLMSGREALVLGSRHGGRAWWKMRQFAHQPLLSLFFNGGHWFFTTLLNVMFGQRLKDPFTMYKVFRRDCIHGLEFRCNRFDFDYELLVKMVRKGYRPVEIPVNYRSRSFKDGKKVMTFRDPITWLRALAWLRWTRLDPLAERERLRAVARSPKPGDV